MSRTALAPGLIACCAAALAPVAATAQPVLSLGSTSANREPIEVDQSITIDVNLTGLADGDALDFLAATVEFDDSLFGTPLITVGDIVPDPEGFLGIADPDLADGSFDAFFTLSGVDSISANGRFFRFTTTALAEGSGTFTVTFADAMGVNANADPIDGADAGAPLTFTVVVPEPATALLLAVPAVLGLRRRR